MAELTIPETRLTLRAVYRYREAGQLLGIARARVQHWAERYTYATTYGAKRSGPILQTSRTPGVLSFLELQELFFVKQFVAHGVPLSEIRRASKRLAQKLGPYPFARRPLVVNENHLIEEFSSEVFARADIGQLVAQFASEFEAHVQFRDGLTSEYMLPDYGSRICLDAQVRAGEPILRASQVPTRVIFDLWRTEHEVDSKAEYFELPREEVITAVRFELDRPVLA